MAESTEIRWGPFFERYRILATRLTAGLCGRPDLAEDLYQEAARAVYERSKRLPRLFESEEHARNYLFRALRNLASDNRRDLTRAPSALEHESGPDSDPADGRPGPDELAQESEISLEHERRIRSIRTGVEALSARHREAIRLRYLKGLTFREMADRTGLSISTLQAQVESALEKLRKRTGNPRLEG